MVADSVDGAMGQGRNQLKGIDVTVNEYPGNAFSL